MNRKSFPDVVAGGDYRASLEALRDELALRVDRAGPEDISPIAGRLVSVLATLDALRDPEERSKADDLAKRRADRVAGSDAAPPAKRRAVNRRG